MCANALIKGRINSFMKRTRFICLTELPGLTWCLPHEASFIIFTFILYKEVEA